jgi:membrane protein YdbS with pleckstrin-like domain
MDDKDFPSIFQQSDIASKKNQKAYINATKIEFIFIVLAAITSGFVLTESSQFRTILLVAITLFILFAFVDRLIIQIIQWDRKWFDARAVAESSKTASWRYIMSIEPFNVEDMEADKKLVQELDQIYKNKPDVILAIASCCDVGNKKITEKMKELRKLSQENKMSLYLNDRIIDQKKWYQKKSKENDEDETRFFFICIFLEISAIVLSILMICNSNWIFNPIGVITTSTAVLYAWIQIKKYRELSNSYAIAAQELDSIESLSNTVTTAEELHKFVVDAETAISREHTMWISKRSIN